MSLINKQKHVLLLVNWYPYQNARESYIYLFVYLLLDIAYHLPNFYYRLRELKMLIPAYNPESIILADNQTFSQFELHWFRILK